MNQNIIPDLVSTIIPVFNRPTMVVESIQSVLEQTYRPIEIIVVDDGSTDNTFDVLQSLAEQYPEIKVLQQANAGPGVARELGRQHASGEFIQYHDSDDLLLPRKFEHQVAALQQNSKCDAAYGKTERRAYGEVLTGTPLKRTGEVLEAMFPASLRSRWWSTSTPLYRRSVIDKTGPWLDTINEEDWEYDCRIASLGGRLCYVDKFVSVTQAHNDHLHFDGVSDPAKLRSRCIARAKNYQHAQTYMGLADRPTDIGNDDWQFFSKSVFLLCRECAIVGMNEEANTMLQLSIKAIGITTVQHWFFIILKTFFGWRGAAKIIKFLGK